VGVPVIGSDVGAITEHLGDGRGILIPAEYQMIDPYGNCNRYYIDKERTCNALMNMAELRENTEEMVKKSHEYIDSRTWNKPILQFDEAVRSLKNDATTQEEGAEEFLSAVI